MNHLKLTFKVAKAKYPLCIRHCNKILSQSLSLFCEFGSIFPDLVNQSPSKVSHFESVLYSLTKTKMDTLISVSKHFFRKVFSRY